MTASATRATSAERCRPAYRRRSSIARRMSASFFAPMPLSAADPPVAGSLFEGVERGHAQLVVEPLDGLGTHALQSEQVEHGRRERGEQFVSERRVARIGDLADARRQVASDARQCPQPASSSAATAVGSAVTVSAALRYARILKGLSPRISSRSPISNSRRAMAALSTASPAL